MNQSNVNTIFTNSFLMLRVAESDNSSRFLRCFADADAAIAAAMQSQVPLANVVSGAAQRKAQPRVNYRGFRIISARRSGSPSRAAAAAATPPVRWHRAVAI